MISGTNCFFTLHFSQQLDSPQEEQLSTALNLVDIELQKLAEIPWLYHVLQPTAEEVKRGTVTVHNGPIACCFICSLAGVNYNPVEEGSGFKAKDLI